MPGPMGLRGLFNYISDDGNTYVVQLDVSNAEAGGFTPAPADAPGANYIRGWKMRHVYGESSDGTRIRLWVTGPSNSLFVNGGTFATGGTSYTVRGRIGEKRPSS